MKHLLALLLLLICSTFANAQESLKIVWLEKYEWKLLSNQENDKLHVVELIPGKERADNWTLLGQMMSIKGALNISMDQAKDLMVEQTKVKAPDAVLTVLEKDEADDYPWILFKLENPTPPAGQHPESQLWYIRQGQTALYLNFIAVKKKKLKNKFVAEWSAVFKASEVVDLSEEGE